MTASALTPSLAAPSQATVTATLMAAKKAKGMSFADLEAALGRLGRAGKELQQRALAGAILAYDPDRLAGVNLEADPAERPVCTVALAPPCS